MDRDKIIIYKTKEGLPAIEVAYGDDTVWLTQKQIAEVFGIQVPAVNKHINNILRNKELDKSTISKMEIVRVEGLRSVKRMIDAYNLDMILSIGYRVNSVRATQFRIWANQILKDYLLKGYALNNKKLREQSQQLLELKQAINN
ncbi:virulence RhuM family protein [Pedobacter soli]|uniref:Virulence protein RhuM family protein n=1 Tax=Pedobacter soli TaxID=390242 RepID=A0A1G7CW02_9SPHI|nr:RhuM family protein [Pedobacter soli]SDE43421.1 Virulence protein RhuM family protein [Pedobacter soli]